MIRNVIFGVLRSALVFPVPFVLTPLILRKIGVRGYGTWAVFLTINNMTSLADLGLVGTLSKYVAEYHAQRDYPALSRLLSTGIALFTLLCLSLVFLLWVGSNLLVAVLFRGSSLEPAALVLLFRYFLILVGANILILLFSSVTSGLQRMDLTNVATAVNVLTAAVLGGFFLIRGWGLAGLLYGYIGAAVLTLLIYIVLVRKLLPQVVLNPLRMDSAEARRIFSFSLRLYLTSAASAIHNQVEKLLLALFVGVSAAGWYDIASDVALKVRGAIALVLAPVLPAAAELNAQRDDRRLEELYYRSHKYLAFVGVPAVCFVATISSRFVRNWIGPNLLMVAPPLSVLVLVNFLNLTTGPGFLIFAGMGRLGAGMRSAMLGIALNVILSLALVYRYGFAGAVVGTSISLVVASAYFLYLFHHQTHFSVWRLLREGYMKPVICSLVLSGVVLALRTVASSSWLGLASQGLALAVAYAAVLLCSRFFDQYDWSKLEALLPVVRRVRRSVRVA